jgi:hypothetical protein
MLDQEAQNLSPENHKKLADARVLADVLLASTVQ